MSRLPLDRSSLVGIDADQMTAVDEPYLRNLATNLRGWLASSEARRFWAPGGATRGRASWGHFSRTPSRSANSRGDGHPPSL